MKKLFFIALLGIVTVNGAKAQTIIASGFCGAQGNNLSWILTSDNVLTINGSGDMQNYYLWDNFAPWHSHRSNVRRVVIGNGVTSIGDYAFWECNLSMSVTIPNSVTRIGEFTFANSALNYVTIPNSVTSIGVGAFQDCRSLSVVNLPNSITTIADDTFAGCMNLMSITIPESVTSIGVRAFSGCHGLHSVTIPNSVITIGDFAFADCRRLGSVIIGDGVTTIGRSAFENHRAQRALGEVTIGRNVTYIGEMAFFLAPLTLITSYALIPPSLDETTFAEVRTNEVILFVPEESLELYWSAPIWQDFWIFPIGGGIGTNVNETQASQVFVYPSFVTDSFQIGGIKEDTHITVSDTNGRIVMQRVVAPNEVISAGHLPQGMYFVNINGETVKIIKSGM